MKTASDPRHQARRLAAAYVYAKQNAKQQSYPGDDKNLIDTILENLAIESYNKDLFREIIDGVENDGPNLFECISRNSIDWDIEKIYKMDLALLLIAVFEIKQNKTPQKVVIDEAVELAKEFGENDSPKFVNGILAGVAKENDHKSN